MPPSPTPPTPPAPQPQGLLERLHIPRPLIWGFVGLTIFMIGDGVETNILEPFLSDEHGFNVSSAGKLVTVYGVAVAIAAFFAAALSDLLGPRKVMILGAVTWVVFQLGFLCLALTTDNTALIYLFYGLRGFGYPLFAYGFLVWITATAPAHQLASGVGWFYVAFSAGLPTLGALTATISMSLFDLTYYQTLWVSLVLVLIGSLVVFLGVQEQRGRGPLVENASDVGATLSRGFALLFRDRRARFVAYIRTINSIPTYAMAVFFPAYFHDDLNWPRSWFLILTAVIYAVNLPFNPIYGRVGDRFGWWRTMIWAGPVCCTITLGLVYFTPMIALNSGLDDRTAFGLTLVAGALFGIALAGYVPLSPIAVALDPKHPGAAMSAYNLGVGGAVAMGPLLVAIFHPLIGATGLILLMMGLFVLAGLMCLAFKGLQPGFDGVPATASLTD
ncbi:MULTISPECIES: RbtT/DalT/CsbX family MFS transporter [unclassified Corynebacterium]|uniref:RbtT/DalT/CsbX family MFS transporter n=1 Tax=unclassified Corynebacterium TaxID=2624378 RepID=UPI0029C9F3FC|nr:MULTISPECIES: RbtT/DalT/CsbX family MFS transporter [unclassified Corynebacterium]WPF65428.1 RbtT/DalT/CsbX family MFS transporter [Corynebacterium sp. 22KM0430]WPF67924.1 RbtT/DalT/CsbX family MFS transporter [Corynebacterium sp. 21KM1197]